MRIKLDRRCLILALGLAGTAFAQETNFASGPQYLMTTGSAMFARPISTPSTSLSGPPLEVGASDATGVLIAGAATHYELPPVAVVLPKIDLFPIFYGDAPVSDIEVRFPKPTENAGSGPQLPPRIGDGGVWQATTAQELREGGYGMTEAEAAAENKKSGARSTRVYTNADIERLRGGS
jgi:hypothetical protein